MSLPAPIAHKITTSIEQHKETRVDDYAWLRDPNWQAVMKQPDQLRSDIRAYLEAENSYTEDYMQDTQVLQENLFTELKARIKSDESTVPTKDGDYFYYLRYENNAQHPRLCRYLANDPDQTEECVLDANALAAEHDYFDMGGCEHSPDHRYLAYSVDTKGSEFYQLYILDLSSDTLLPETIDNVQGDIVWAMDNQTLFYTTLDDHHRADKVFRHTLHSATDQDTLVYTEADKGFFVSLDRTESDNFILISAHDHNTSESHYIPADQPTVVPQCFQPRVEGIEYYPSDQAGHWLIMTNANGCENYKIMRCSFDQTQIEHWQDYYLPAEGSLLKNMFLYEHYLVRTERRKGLPKITIQSVVDGELTADAYSIDFDEEAYELGVDGSSEFSSNLLRFSYTSMTTPTQIYDFDMHSRKRELRKQQEVPSGHDKDDFCTRRVFADNNGCQVPISLLYHRDTPLDGSAPLLLYAYGSYGSSMPASFSTTRLSLVKRGFVYAIAHIRGGMELGYDWYRQGKLMQKKNTFADFISASKHLVKESYADADKITIHGGSAGGMLIGAVLNLEPTLYHSAIADVPFVDVLNTMSDDSLPLTPPEWPEWGNPIEDKAAYDYIKSYSPYENVSAQAYPHILVTAGLTDPRVTYWEPAKWVAKLREYSSSDHTLLLKTHMDAGHAGASGRYDSLKEVALMYAFVLKMHGMTDSD